MLAVSVPLRPLLSTLLFAYPTMAAQRALQLALAMPSAVLPVPTTDPGVASPQSHPVQVQESPVALVLFNLQGSRKSITAADLHPDPDPSQPTPPDDSVTPP